MADDTHDIRDDLAAYLDGELDNAARGCVEARLADDAALRAELDDLREVDAHYRALPDVHAPEDFEARVRDRLDDEHRVGMPIRLSAHRRHERQRQVWPLLAAAAVVAMLAGIFVPYYLSGPPKPFEVARSKTTNQADGQAQDEIVYEFEVRPMTESAIREAPEQSAPATAEEAAPRQRQLDALEALGYLGANAGSGGAAPQPVPQPEPEPEPAPPALLQDALPAEAAAPPMEPEALRSIAAAPPEPEMQPGAAFDGASIEQDRATGGAVARQKAVIMPRVFSEVGDTHIEKGYDGAPYEHIAPGEPEVAAAIEADINLRDLIAAGQKVLFRVGDHWYLVSPLE